MTKNKESERNELDHRLKKMREIEEERMSKLE